MSLKYEPASEPLHISVKGRDHQKMGDLTRETDRMKVYLLLLLDSRYRS